MRTALKFLPLPLLLLAALVSRHYSPGLQLSRTVTEYLRELREGNGAGARALYTDSLALLVSPSFLDGLEGFPEPDRVFVEGADARGTRLTAVAGSRRRTIWLATEAGVCRVRGDTSLDALLGGAVLACRQAALSGAPVCPVSGREYSFSGDSVVCPSGHLGAGLSLSPEACEALREEAAASVREFVQAGYGIPGDLESIYTTTGGEMGRRGGWRCPDNGYSYYHIIGDSVVCEHHGASTPVYR
jgi:hypothetical protein